MGMECQKSCDCCSAVPSNANLESTWMSGLDPAATCEWLKQGENWLDIIPKVRAAGACVRNQTESGWEMYMKETDQHPFCVALEMNVLQNGILYWKFLVKKDGKNQYEICQSYEFKP